MTMAENRGLLTWQFSNVDLDQPAMNAARTLRNETIANRAEVLDQLIEKLLEDDTLQPFLDPNFLMRFLRGAKFDYCKAYSRLKRYYGIRSKHPSIFGTYLPSSTLQAQSLNHISALPNRANDNSIVLIHKLGKFDPNISSFEEFLRLDILTAESMLQNPVTQLCGITAILDFGNLSLEQFSELSPSRIQMCFDIFHSACTLRIVNVHLINIHGLASSLFNLAIPVMTQKMKDRFFIHSVGDWKVLHSHIQPETLTEEYGGQLRTSQLVNVYDLINNNEDYFNSQSNCGLLERR